MIIAISCWLLATAEQVTEVRGGWPSIESLRVRGLGGTAVSNLGLLVSQTSPNWGILAIKTKLFNYKHVEKAGVAYFCMYRMLGTERSIRVFI